MTTSIPVDGFRAYCSADIIIAACVVLFEVGIDCKWAGGRGIGQGSGRREAKTHSHRPKKVQIANRTSRLGEINQKFLAAIEPPAFWTTPPGADRCGKNQQSSANIAVPGRLAAISQASAEKGLGESTDPTRSLVSARQERDPAFASEARSPSAGIAGQGVGEAPGSCRQQCPDGSHTRPKREPRRCDSGASLRLAIRPTRETNVSISRCGHRKTS